MPRRSRPPSGVQALDAAGNALRRLRAGRLPDPQDRPSPSPLLTSTPSCRLWVTYPGQGREHHRGRRELVEQLQVPDRQRPLRPEEPRAVRARLLHPEPQLLGRQGQGRHRVLATSPTPPWPSRPTRTTSSTSSPLAAEDLATVKADPTLSKEANDLPRLLHLRRHVPPAEGTLHRPEGPRGLRHGLRPRGLGEGRAERPGLPDPDLDPARASLGTTQGETRWGLRSRGRQAGAGRVHLRQRRQAAARSS